MIREKVLELREGARRFKRFQKFFLRRPKRSQDVQEGSRKFQKFPEGSRKFQDVSMKAIYFKMLGGMNMGGVPGRHLFENFVWNEDKEGSGSFANLRFEH